ncbi:hypothetical protein AD929_02275 [Gluconobacter potus]|uniref:Uncharacterized protein n=1 Tax=Gluconobacter potus TaxID=2724927 RepID=A0A149QZH8_9PROT|nr:hypothetical protein [Gluconobacter potus]KXV02537.1 hypothetical protein AD929_02275 [Gluconobacter potus]
MKTLIIIAVSFLALDVLATVLLHTLLVGRALLHMLMWTTALAAILCIAFSMWKSIRKGFMCKG